MELFNVSFFGISGWDIDMNHCDVEWITLETNQDHSVIFETAPKYWIPDSADYEIYSISSKGFLPTIVDIMVIRINVAYFFPFYFIDS